MLHRVIGASGSGKTEYLLDRMGELLNKGRDCVVIVPEQQSVDYEALLCERFGDGMNMHCEVLNFERLPNRIAREYGNLAINNIDKGGACALLSIICEEQKKNLTEFASVAEDVDFASSMFMFISRMKMAAVTPSMLKDALNSGECESEPRIYAKLKDIFVIYSEYEKHFGLGIYDPRDALTRLCDELPQKPFFSGKTVFIDNYYTFTQQEYNIIEQIIAQSSDTYISFTGEDRREFFAENLKAAEYIKKLARGKSDDFYTNEPSRANYESLRAIERNIWNGDSEQFCGDDNAVKLINAKNRFDEVESVAEQISEFVQNGGRYRDIAVLAGNTEAYSAIVDAVFSRSEIPVYMSAKEEIITKPLFAFLLSSLSVIAEDFSLSSIKRYIKSGYTDLTVNESDVLLSYAQAWKLRGKAWYGEHEWTLDPEGYREGDITERGARLLKTANVAREKLITPLSALRDSINKKELTVSEALSALYTHLMSMRVDERLRLSAERALKNNERERSDRIIQLWKILINIFDQLNDICGDKIVTPKRLITLLRLMCDCYSLGAIPVSSDAVTFGDASLIRAGGKKMVAVLGVCDGEFPKSTKNSGFFDRDEAVFLEGIGLNIGDTMQKQLNTNRFFVYAAFSAPTEKLVITTPASELAGGELRPSTAYLSVRAILPELKEDRFDAENSFYSREAVASNFPLLRECEMRDRIERALQKTDTPYFATEPKVIDRESRIEYDSERLNLSPSKFETYAKCPFSFFGNYLLALKEKKENEFSMPEIGNYVHKMLELFVRECVKSGRFVRPSESERISLIKKLSDEYFNTVIGAQMLNDKMFMHTYRNMEKTVDFVTASLAEEFSESDFVPSGFEFKIGLGDADMPAMSYDVDGKTVTLRGSIDRVDTYVKNGVTYVRVVDYKTYDKSFSLELLPYGLDTQMLHYLFAYCQNADAVPAGVFYYTVTLPNVQIDGRETEEEIKKLVAKCIKRNGIVIDDADIVFAMSNDYKFVPVKRNKDGNLYSYGNSKKTFTSEEFGEIKTTLDEQINKLSKSVFCGNMDISPLEIEGKTVEPCKYCALGDFCRNKKQDDEGEEDEDVG